MTSFFVKFLYSFTYFVYIPFILEIYNVLNNWGNISFYWPKNIGCDVVAFLKLHYPLFFIVVLCYLCKKILRFVADNMTEYAIMLKKSSLLGVDSMIVGIPIIPALSFLLAFLNVSFLPYVLITAMLITSLFLVSNGGYNITLLLLGYKQYKVSSEHSEYWLISKKQITDFSQSVKIKELSERIILNL